jgi:hypothetical protein
MLLACCLPAALGYTQWVSLTHAYMVRLHFGQEASNITIVVLGGGTHKTDPAVCNDVINSVRGRGQMAQQAAHSGRLFDRQCRGCILQPGPTMVDGDSGGCRHPTYIPPGA